ncbi:ATP-binding cassette sub-family A member 6 [Homo sapiens] [Rhizoctonia solani]|uniref:ATP-binding cassette sub-family A member 6 [Homo sapiens] n=1 Tax=Rhizoctonia solani TaxID=456999 RepID=A0A0K6GHX3_9AGAM|nr:ATP-binding cassette sub-family A member 6 [Homo sapiens] [Rhizoctonia solani]
MHRLKTQTIWGILMIATWIEGIVAYRINVTAHDTNEAHVNYSDEPVRCNRWVNNWVFWKACDSWVKPWASGIYHSQGKQVTFHSSLNHQLASVTIEFKGTDVWVYGPPLSQLAELPPDYRICLHESYHVSSKHQCYQINIAKAYSDIGDEDEPVVIFSRGQLQDQHHRIVISVADPVDDIRAYTGVQFSHATYTISRPTPWPVEEDYWRYRKVVMDDTHPLLSYSPQPPSSWFSSPPWSAKVSTAEDGTVTSWHELESHNEENRDQWGIETKIKAGAVVVYGAPRAYINPDNLAFVCVRMDLGLCETVDLKTIYANEKFNAQYEPVLLWRNDALDPSRETHIFIRLVNAPTGVMSVFPFKSIVYFEEQEYSSPEPFFGSSENVTIDHDNQAISYNPGRRCDGHSIFGDCNSWFDPWAWREVGPLGSVLTFRSTFSMYRVKEDPHITLDFKGSAVYLFGAPKTYAPRHFAPQHVCLNNVCRVIDVEQAYLQSSRDDMKPAGINEAQGQNTTIQEIITPLSSPHPELEPVLISATTGLDDKTEHTLRLALAPSPAPDDAVMTIVRVVYTKVSYRYPGRPDPPAPKPDRTFRGPLQPLYATKWALLDHKPPPPFSIDPPPPAQSPFPLLFAIILLVTGAVALPRVRRLWHSKTRETQPLLSEGHPPQHSRPRGYAEPPPGYPNPTDVLPSYSSSTNNTSNRRR